MNAQRTTAFTHFGTLFLTALGGWVAFNLANGGTAFIVPGVIVAGLIAYGGTLVALRFRASDLRTTHPQAPVAHHYTAIPAARGVFAMPAAAPRFEMDIAAGD